MPNGKFDCFVQCVRDAIHKRTLFERPPERPYHSFISFIIELSFLLRFYTILSTDYHFEFDVSETSKHRLFLINVRFLYVCFQ